VSTQPNLSGLLKGFRLQSSAAGKAQHTERAGCGARQRSSPKLAIDCSLGLLLGANSLALARRVA
jgi:hypothetical protein